MQVTNITLDVNLTDGYGIDRYPYGADGLISFKVARRGSAGEKPKVTVTTNTPFRLTLMWGDNKIEKEIKKGTQTV